VQESEKDREQYKQMSLPRWMKYTEEPIIEMAGNMP
jgi:CRP-like cAMP-binding protein